MVSTTFLYNQLSKYGLSSSGNIQSDLAELKKVKEANKVLTECDVKLDEIDLNLRTETINRITY